MSKKHHCKNCSYFLGKQGIHCAVHPYGKEQEYCSDWQQTKLNLQEEKSMNTDTETKSFSYPKFASHLLAIGATFLIGYQLHQNIPPAIRANENYDIYEIKCEIFLERASNAGTTGIASIELAIRVNWLKSNSSTQSFEYKNLAANLNYLEEQPKNTLMPKTIKDSIEYNLKDIKVNQLKRKDEGKPGKGSLVDFVMYILASILICLIMLVLLAIVMELIEIGEK